jgi:hypothetical protein
VARQILKAEAAEQPDHGQDGALIVRSGSYAARPRWPAIESWCTEARGSWLPGIGPLNCWSAFTVTPH